jgi:hypothetical protein
MRNVFIALATSAAIFAIGQSPAGAQSNAFCIQGDEFGSGECSFATYAQCEASASGRTAYCEPNRYLATRAMLVVRPQHPRHHRSH